MGHPSKSQSLPPNHSREGLCKLNRHSPNSGLVVGHDRPFGCLGQWYIAHRVRSRQSNQPVDCAEALKALKRAGLPIRAHLRRHRLSSFDPCAAHAGAGGARSRAISDRISANICRGTATSAI